MDAIATRYADALWDAADGLEPQAVQRLIDGFIDLMAKRGHLPEAPAVIEALDKRLRTERGTVEVKITTATELDQAEAGRIEADLAKSLGKPVALETATDPALIGGAVIRTGDTQIDSSIRHRLDLLKQRISE